MTVKMQTQPDSIKAISEIAEAMPLASIVQLYEFALFLKTNPLPTEETFEQIIADEALWDMQFAATPIDAGKTLPMFDEHGEFIEHQ